MVTTHLMLGRTKGSPVGFIKSSYIVTQMVTGIVGGAMGAASTLERNSTEVGWAIGGPITTHFG